jgi:hypothetical protein
MYDGPPKKKKRSAHRQPRDRRARHPLLDKADSPTRNCEEDSNDGHQSAEGEASEPEEFEGWGGDEFGQLSEMEGQQEIEQDEAFEQEEAALEARSFLAFLLTFSHC